MALDQIIVFFFILTASLYVFGFMLLCLDRNAESARNLASRAAWFGFASHTLLLGCYIYEVSRMPFGNPYEILVSLVWAFVFAQLIGVVIFKTRALLLFSLPAAAILLLLPLGCPLFLSNYSAEVGRLKEISSAHASLAIFSYAVFALAGVLSAIYLWQKRALRAKESKGVFPETPSLKKLFKYCKWSLTVSALLMFAAIILGALDAKFFFSQGLVTPLYILKFSLGTLVFAFQIFLMSLCWSGRFQQARICSTTIFAVLLSFMLLIPMELKNFF